MFYAMGAAGDDDVTSLKQEKAAAKGMFNDGGGL